MLNGERLRTWIVRFSINRGYAKLKVAEVQRGEGFASCLEEMRADILGKRRKVRVNMQQSIRAHANLGTDVCVEIDQSARE